jgi:hypothetical protein
MKNRKDKGKKKGEVGRGLTAGRAAHKICCMGRRARWAGWAEFGPVGSDLFFFLFSYFFHNFCILAPNELKPISKFF